MVDIRLRLSYNSYKYEKYEIYEEIEQKWKFPKGIIFLVL